MIKYTYLFKVNGKYLSYYNHRDKEIRLSDNIKNAKIFQGNPRTQIKKLTGQQPIGQIEVLQVQLQEGNCLKAEMELFLQTAQKQHRPKEHSPLPAVEGGKVA